MTIVRTVAPEERLAATHLEIRDAGADGKFIEGVAAPFNTWDDIGPYMERFSPGVFDTTLSRNPERVPLMVQHESHAIPVGKPVEFRKSDDHLYGVWQFDSRSEAREVYRLIEDGMLTGLSVSFLPGKKKGDNIVERGEDDILRVTRMNARLMEVSVVSVPAIESAGISVVRTAGAQAVEDLVVSTPRLEAAAARHAELVARIDALLGGTVTGK